MTETDPKAEHLSGSDRVPPPMDWGRGAYENVAPVLLPAARALLRTARLRPGHRVADIGCGTGNVALLAARAGAEVTGVDPASRLLVVGEQAARHEGLGIRFLRGEAASLPVPDHSQDRVLSNFGIIFAADPAAAVAEMVRVLAPGGRIVFTAWLPGGLLGRMNDVAAQMIRDVVGAPPPPPAFPWHDPVALDSVFGPYGLSVAREDHELAFTASSPEAYLDRDRISHPLAVAGFELLERAGQAQRARERLLTILRQGNEDLSAFRTTSRYAILAATSSAGPSRSVGPLG